MHIAGMDYYLGRKCLEIYISGCNSPHCFKCHNPGLQNFSSDDNLEQSQKEIYLKIATGMVEEIHLLGGEPLDQDLKKLKELIIFIKTFKKYNIKIWLWTKYDDYMDRIDFLHLIDYVKYGRYEKDLPSYTDKNTGIVLASNNQKIIKIS